MKPKQPKPVKMWAIVAKHSGRYAWIFHTRNTARKCGMDSKKWKIIRVTVTPDAPKARGK